MMVVQSLSLCMDPTLYVIYSRRPAATQVQNVSVDLLLYAHQFLNYFVANLISYLKTKYVLKLRFYV